MKKIVPLIAIMFLCNIILFAQKDKRPKMFMNGPEHTGKYKNTNANHFEKLKWMFPTGGKIYGSPVVADGIVYIGSSDKNFYAINAKSGDSIWSYPTGGAVHSTPVVHHGTVYFLSFDGKFYALDAKTGKKKWIRKTGGEKWVGSDTLYLKGYGFPEIYKEDVFQYFLSSPVVNESKQHPYVYIGSSDSSLYAFDQKNGVLIWKKRFGGPIHTSPALHNNTLFFGCWDRNVYAIDAISGKERWRQPTLDTWENLGIMRGIQGSPTVANGKVYIGSRDAHFYEFDEKTGKPSWTYLPDPTTKTWILSTPAIGRGEIYTTTSDNHLFLALDPKTKTTKYTFKTGAFNYSSPAIAGNTAFFGSYNGKLYALDLNSEGKRWEEFQVEGSKKYLHEFVNEKEEIIWWQLMNVDADYNYYKADVELKERLDKIGPIVSSPAVVDDVVYFGSADGNLYAVQLGKNKAPDAAIVSPSRSKEFLTGSTIEIKAQSRDKNGIASIEYFANDLKIGQNTAGKLTWSNVPAGKHTLSIKVTDKKGGKTLSDTLSIFVKDTIEKCQKDSEKRDGVENIVVYPNPFETNVTIDFILKKSGVTNITLYNEKGKHNTILNKTLQEGKHTITIDGSDLHHDVYYCKIKSGRFVKIVRLIKK